MPGTTRYSATFDRTYEEEAKPSSPPNARRSRSQSWQANSGHDGRQYTPFASRSPAPRSSSTDNNLSNGTEFIPTRTAKTSVKAHNNPFQFVKVGTCPLYKKAEEQLKKAKETKKPDVLKEEEEEWQTNLDSWKSRRRKMSEDVFRRQEELKLLELEEQIAQVSNKKTKTFSEMVESRATRGRALSLCLLTSPLEFQNWEFENKAHKSGSCSFTDESGENSIVNSEDEGVSVRGRHEENSINENAMNHRTNGDAHIEQNGTALDKQNGNCNKLSNNVQMKTKENSYIDSGLESISSSHRAGDTPDSGSDFSQDSNSSIDCDSPRTGVNVLEEFSSKSSQISEGHEIRIILKLDEKGQDFGFTFLGGKDEGQVIIASILEGSKAESSGIHLGDRIIMIDGCDVNSRKHIEIAALIQKGREKNQMSLLLWRHTKPTNGTNGFIAEAKHNKVITDENFNAKSYEKSIESENEMFVDDFEELKRQSELLANKKSVAANAQANGNKHCNKDAISLKTSSESSTAPIPKINTSNSAVEEPNKNEEKTEINSENQKKNIIKVKRVRRKGVYALNVDSNQISQDGHSTTTLFPLSPVTELPSPADETKTMSSTLSSNITLPVSNSQNGFPDEGKQKNAENIKSNIPVSKENNSVIPTSANTENSKSATLQTGSKNVENKIQLNTENETEIANSPTLSSKNKDSQDEKFKSQPTPKKIKASKLKKGMPLENTSAASECTNELTSVTQCEDVTSETVIQEKSSSESKSSHLENKQLSIKNDVKNLTALESMESNISSKSTPVKPATEIITVPTKTPSTSTVSNGIGIQSPKVVANSIKAPTTSIPPKLSTSEDSKPKKNIQKKVIAKSKGMALENTSAASECTNELTSVTQCEDVTSETVIQEKSSSESKSSPLKNKQLSIKNDVKNLTALESMESNISSKNIPVKPATETISVPTKTPSTSAVSNGIGIQSPKVVANSIKAATTSIPPKLLASEDSKPKKNIQKKVIAKSKGMALENTSAASECTNELTSVTQCEDVTSETVIQEKSSSESKSSPLKNKQLSIKNDVKNLTALESMESNISSKNIPVKPATETISVPTKTPSTSAVSNGIGIQSPKVVANSIKAATTSIPPKLLASEDSKPKKNIQKKVIAKSKGMALENTSAASECTNELTSVTQCEDVTSETVIQEKSSSESKSSHLENKQLSIKNDVKNLTALESMESNISSKNIPVKPATETISVPTKTPSSAVSYSIGIQSPKVVANSIKAPTTSIPPKLFTSEDSKPKKNIQKKVIAKSKGMALENTSAVSECTNELTSVTQCEDVTSETVIQEKSSSESKSSHLENKQLSIKNDVKNLTALESMESNISSKNIPVKPATETISVPTKTPSSAVSYSIGIQSPKVVANSIKAPTTSIPPKLFTSEDSKPKKNIQKKVIAKSKGMALENTSAASECTNELTSVTQCEDVTSETVIQEKSSSESKSSHLENKQLSIKNDVKNLTALESMESNISSKNIPVKPATETISVPTKTPSSAVSYSIGIQSPKVVANSIKAPTTSIPPKLFTSEDSKPKKNIQKKVIAKSKGMALENTSAVSECTNELTSVTQCEDVTSETVIQEKSSSESKSSHLENKQLSIKNDVKNLTALESMESNISSKNTPVKPATEIISVPTKTTSSAVSNGIGIQSPKVVANSIKAPTTSIHLLTSEDSKPKKNIQKKVIAKSKDNITEKTSCGTSTNSTLNEIYSTKEQSSSIVEKQEKVDSKNEIAVSPLKEESNISLNGIANVPQETNQSPKDETSIPCPSTNKVRDLTLKFGVKKPSMSSESSVPSKNAKALKSPVNEKTKPGVVEKESTKAKENCVEQNLIGSPVALSSVSNSFDSSSKNTSLSNKDKQIKIAVKDEIIVASSKMEKGMLSLDIGVNDATAVDKQSHKLPSPVVPANNPTSIVTPVNKSESDIVSPEISVTKNSIPKSPVNSPDEKPKLPIPKRSRNRSKKKSANSQKVNTPAKLNEESKISNDSLNVVFQSQPKNMGSENITNNKNFENNNNRTAISTDLVTDVPPVDKIAEEMEKLILEQLEEEERAKELSTGKILVESSPEHLLTAPPRLAEPPKEKPPPPPSTENPKDSSLKRVNSTKRIKKEIYKRRSNFLGIENADESIICSESSVPPPPALEEILKAEMELDRQTRLRIENEATERLTLEEKEIMQKEREIIESLESEERRKMYMNGTGECNNVYMSNSTSDAVCEQGHIESLKCEKKRIDTELQLSEEQQQILIEEKQLKEREEFIRQQEAAISTASLSDSSLSVSANTANNLKKPALSSVPTEVQSNGLLLGTNGDGSGLALSSSTEVSMNETSKGGKKIKASEKPAVPPKPLKKKEAIRKERERLRQEQEALQREREEHRRKLMLEQEELMKQQKNHAPDAPASRLGPHPPQIQPSFPPQLTTTMNATPNARENASFPSRSHHGTSNTAAGSLNAVELMGPPVVRQNIRPAPRKAAQNEAWGQQKMPSVRKQNHESLPESRYNQNHWLIQEAEMRRIAELKERQRTTQTPCTQTHLAEDDVCSNPPRVPVISPTHNPHLNYPVQEKVWNYGQSNMPLKKYPPPVVKEPPLHTIYPRETVPQQPPTKPSRVVPSERQEQMLSVSGRKRCSHCNEELGRGAAMIIESLQLYYHIHCFQCCVCQAQLGNGSCGTDVRVRNNKLHCHNCYSNDEAGLKFSQV